LKVSVFSEVRTCSGSGRQWAPVDAFKVSLDSFTGNSKFSISDSFLVALSLSALRLQLAITDRSWSAAGRTISVSRLSPYYYRLFQALGAATRKACSANFRRVLGL